VPPEDHGQCWCRLRASSFVRRTIINLERVYGSLLTIINLGTSLREFTWFTKQSNVAIATRTSARGNDRIHSVHTICTMSGCPGISMISPQSIEIWLENHNKLATCGIGVIRDTLPRAPPESRLWTISWIYSPPPRDVPMDGLSRVSLTLQLSGTLSGSLWFWLTLSLWESESLSLCALIHSTVLMHRFTDAFHIKHLGLNKSLTNGRMCKTYPNTQGLRGSLKTLKGHGPGDYLCHVWFKLNHGFTRNEMYSKHKAMSGNVVRGSYRCSVGVTMNTPRQTKSHTSRQAIVYMPCGSVTVHLNWVSADMILQSHCDSICQIDGDRCELPMSTPPILDARVAKIQSKSTWGSKLTYDTSGWNVRRMLWGSIRVILWLHVWHCMRTEHAQALWCQCFCRL